MNTTAGKLAVRGQTAARRPVNVASGLLHDR